MKKFILITFCCMMTTCTAQNTNKMMKEIVSPYRYTSHFQTLKDGEISYIKEGNGEQIIVFLHGLSSNADAWSKNIAQLTERYTCYALDLPGFGKSYKEAEVFTPTYFAEVVKEFLDTQKINKIILVGHSMGGQASIRFAEKYPDMVSHLVLVAPAGIEQFSEAEATTLKMYSTQNFFKNTTDEQIRNNYAVNFYEMPADAETMIKDRIYSKEALDFDAHTLAIEKSVKGMLDDKVVDDLGKIKVPTLLLFAEQDKLIPNRFLHPAMTIQQVAQTAQKSIKNSMLVMIPNSGHFLQFEKPKEVNDRIVEFLKN